MLHLESCILAKERVGDTVPSLVHGLCNALNSGQGGRYPICDIEAQHMALSNQAPFSQDLTVRSSPAPLVASHSYRDPNTPVTTTNVLGRRRCTISHETRTCG
jgi:hypothetical protein